ncbi:hypothetical protein ACFORH_12265 [Amycolatopsis roodepoortensis]|uniref:Uncharacterized protein n=1 Tax=Amycolatopsis roodepoortensis TaxID=700274 RepID=A0ABR9L0A3_9PSEU|nr:hypothetical protein [Amycolatopsis roodepoortensis]MBE1574036.1 hypothetical protein [Amycolatopsis roodepoortensis]
MIDRPPPAIQQEGRKRIIGSLSTNVPIQLLAIYRDNAHDGLSTSGSGWRACRRTFD